MSHPRALGDLLINKSAAIADVVKEKEFILTGIASILYIR